MKFCICIRCLASSCARATRAIRQNRKLVSQAIRVGDRTQVTSVTRCSLRGLMGQGAAREARSWRAAGTFARTSPAVPKACRDRARM